MIKDKQSFFSQRMMSGLLWPSVISSFGLSIGGIADAVFVGGKLGEQGLAAVGLTYPVFMFVNMIGIAIASGGSVKFTREMSEGRPKSASAVFMNALYAVLASGALIGVLGAIFSGPVARFLGAPETGEVFRMTSQYAGIILAATPLSMMNMLGYYMIRADDDQKIASAGLIIGNIIDISLNALLVLAFDMGILGAALSTVIGYAVSVAIYSLHFAKKSRIMRFARVKPEPKQIFEMLRTGIASSSQYMMSFISMTVVNNYMMAIGGAAYVAVYDVTVNVSSVLYSIFDGAAGAMQPIIGTFFGERNRVQIKMSLRGGMFRAMAAAIPATVLTAVFAETVVALFGLEGAGSAAMASEALRIMCCGVLPAGFSIIMLGYLQSVDLENGAFIVSLLRTLVLYLACLFAFGETGMVWWFIPAAETATAVVIALMASRKKGVMCIAESRFDRVMSAFIDNDEVDIGAITARSEEFCDENGADMSQSYCVSLVIEEVCGAIIGNAFGKGKEQYIQITLCAEGEGTFVLYLRDSATSFDPFSMKAGKINSVDAADKELDSIGILMVKKKAKSWFYRRYRGFNTLVIKM